MPIKKGIKDLKKDLYSKRKKDIDCLAKVLDSLKLYNESNS